MSMEDAFAPSYEELASAWHAISEALEVKAHPWKSEQQNKVFCELLKQCGWTIEAWNDEVAFRKTMLEASAEELSPDDLIDDVEDEKGPGSQEK